MQHLQNAYAFFIALIIAFFIALISTWTTQQMCYTWSECQQLLEMDLSDVLEYTHNVNHSRSFFRGFVYT